MPSYFVELFDNIFPDGIGIYLIFNAFPGAKESSDHSPVKFPAAISNIPPLIKAWR
jgi:hypothetical protein